MNVVGERETVCRKEELALVAATHGKNLCRQFCKRLGALSPNLGFNRRPFCRVNRIPVEIFTRLNLSVHKSRTLVSH